MIVKMKFGDHTVNVEITQRQVINMIKLYEHHFRYDLPVLAALLGVDINGIDSYQEVLKELI